VTSDVDRSPMIVESVEPMDPLTESEQAQAKNRAKVGTARPSSLLYTYGVGSIMDLPQFSIMPAGLDDWEPIWRRRPTVPTIEEPRLLKVVQLHLGPGVRELRPFPWQPQARSQSQEGSDLGIPARVFPQWLRCTGCDYLGPLSRFTYTNTHPFRPDLASFEHLSCPGRSRPDRDGAKKGKTRRSPAIPARYLLACANGHLDEFPYGLWVHHGMPCPVAPLPDLKLRDANLGQGAGAIVTCERCKQTRRMTEAQGEAGKAKLPPCRGRHAHLNGFDPKCGLAVSLIMMGASNLWFASTQSIIVMPRTAPEERAALATRLGAHLSPDKLEKYAASPDILRDLLDGKLELDVSDEQLTVAVREALAPGPSEEERHEQLLRWDPVELLVPEWGYLQRPSLFAKQENASGLMVTEMPKGSDLPKVIDRVIAVNRMKKVNAILGFTRLDEMERVGDVATRLVKLTRDGRPAWVPATEDRGEGIFLQLDENAVAAWEARILVSPLWAAHRRAHRRNFTRRFSETAETVDPDTRLRAPRYWLVHTLSHVLIREMAMSCGYGAASLSERLYAWPSTVDRDAAAGLLVCTTASDSEGTLGGLVALSDPERLQDIVTRALRRAARCSSDPVCAQRIPRDPEDFLHGAACHCCSFASETSCERANRFLDRRFLLGLPTGQGELVPGFFGAAHDR
jgi:Domain of unknown function (DUF1998)